MKNKINVTWLGECPECNSNNVIVNTSRDPNEGLVNEGDMVTCSCCGSVGDIVVYDDIAECIWRDE